MISKLIIGLVAIVLYMYYKLTKNKNYCKVFRVKGIYLSEGQSPYKVALTGEELKAIYCLYLRSYNDPNRLSNDYKN